MEPTAWNYRIAAARAGWQSSIEIMNRCYGALNNIYASVRFSRWDWHGRMTDRVEFYRVFKLNSPDEILRKIEIIWDQAQSAWISYPEAIPCQDADRRTVTNEIATRVIFMEPRKSTDFFPREDLGHLETFPYDGWVDSFCSAAERFGERHSIEDLFSPGSGLQDPQARRWVYKLSYATPKRENDLSVITEFSGEQAAMVGLRAVIAAHDARHDLAKKPGASPEPV